MTEGGGGGQGGAGGGVQGGGGVGGEGEVSRPVLVLQHAHKKNSVTSLTAHPDGLLYSSGRDGAVSSWRLVAGPRYARRSVTYAD